MQGGAGGGIALTAYTLIAFLENTEEIPKNKDAINNAIAYIFQNVESLEDNYALALAAYAVQLAQHSEKDKILSMLNAKAMSDANHKWWHKSIPDEEKNNGWYYKPNSVNIEMTAYGMLAFIEADVATSVIPIMKWLVAQRNDKGGFQSTQDTVVGLQALAKFAEKMSSADQNVEISMAEHTFIVSTENKLLMQSYEPQSSRREIQISATGHGFAIVQVSYKYHVKGTGEWPRFNLRPQLSESSNPDKLHLSVCTSFVAVGDVKESNMAVMEVSFPSGFTADLDKLPTSNEGVKVYFR
jgi:CD109 antigen